MLKKVLITGITGQDGSYLAEFYELRGDSSKAKQKLGWKPSVYFKDLVKMMIDAEMKRIKKI